MTGHFRTHKQNHGQSCITFDVSSLADMHGSLSNACVGADSKYGSANTLALLIRLPLPLAAFRA
jgi:hypothetical protein